MNTTQQVLWKKIQAFQFDIPEADFCFSDRLARENGWDKDYTLDVIEEYRKFLFLMCTSTHPLTPSDQVDQAWHLHMVYTHSYWVELCQNTLQQEIHHGPTKGSAEEKEKFNDWYARTLDTYQDTFGQVAPTNIWPSPDDRFQELNYQRVNMHQNWVIKKPEWGSFLTTLLLIGIWVGMVIGSAGKLSIGSGIVIVFGAIFFYIATKFGTKGSGNYSGGVGCGSCGGCGGCGGCG